MVTGVSALRKEARRPPSPLCWVRTQMWHSPWRERSQADTLSSGFEPLRCAFLVIISRPVCRNLLQQPGWAKTLMLYITR